MFPFRFVLQNRISQKNHYGKTPPKKEIIWPRSAQSLPMTCQYPEEFRRLTSRRNLWVGNWQATNLTRSETLFRGSKSVENRWRFCTIPFVSLEEEIIDKDFLQSFWRSLQLFVFTCVSQASQGKSHGSLFKFNYYWQLLPLKCRKTFLRFWRKVLPYCIICIVQ